MLIFGVGITVGQMTIAIAAIVATVRRDLPVQADPERALAPVSEAAAALLRQSGRPCVAALATAMAPGT
jgi:hypothetical protein